MDSLDDVGTGDGEDVVVPLEVVTVILETFSAEVLLRQGMALDHRPHRTIEQGNPVLEERPQEGVRFIVW